MTRIWPLALSRKRRLLASKSIAVSPPVPDRTCRRGKDGVGNHGHKEVPIPVDRVSSLAISSTTSRAGAHRK
jgi:hypothetical protein